MKIRKFLRQIARRLKDPALIDAFGRTRSTVRLAQEGNHILIATAGNGNIGDDAMVEAFLNGVDGPVTIVCRSAHAFPRVDRNTRISFLELPWLVQHAYFPLSLVAAARYVRALRNARSVSVVGADIMDGGYIWQNSVIRANMARWAAVRGIDSRILGFSWSTTPDARAASALTRADAAGVKLLPRDPQSQQRIEELVGHPVPACADIVFSDERVAETWSLSQEFAQDPRAYVLFNVSGLVSKRGVDQVPAALAVIEHLTSAGKRVVLLPHVVRADDGGDVTIGRKIWATVPTRLHGSVSFVEETLRPDQVRSLARGAELIVTGRMHLSIIGLSQGRPAVVVATQGKVAGLMERFNTAELQVEPESIESGGLLDAVKELNANVDSYASRVQRALPDVKALSAANFADLGD